ncbi:MAG: hypothetical protein MJA83_18970 [Gammaproteobacteria bacterium]|nr:hypothetical protein [Gammaproteobacteria bacterium]
MNRISKLTALFIGLGFAVSAGAENIDMYGPDHVYEIEELRLSAARINGRIVAEHCDGNECAEHSLRITADSKIYQRVGDIDTELQVGDLLRYRGKKALVTANRESKEVTRIIVY